MKKRPDIKNQGLVYLFTGDGKGKTSAALGIAVRGLVNGWKVGWVSWYKDPSWGISEHRLDTVLTNEARGRLTFLPMGKGFYLGEKGKTVKAHAATLTDKASKREHRQAASGALRKAEQLLPSIHLLILDEVCNAVNDGLLSERDVIGLLDKRNRVHVILTGRHASLALQRKADLASEIKKLKHPFDQGTLAVQGLDF